MSLPASDRMTREEVRAGLSLASIFSLRMLGLFLVLPVFALGAKHLPGGTDLMLVGLALGAYGLTQAMFQLPFGMASDRWGRKRMIVLGLLLFAAGSFVAASAQDIVVTILGRSLQGAGAISAAVTALAADLTREQHRTKVMAMIGSSIGLMFAVSLVLAPVLYRMAGIAGIFAITGCLALLAIFVVLRVVPAEPSGHAFHGEPTRLRDVLSDTQLLRLNFGILALHATQMAMFVVVPQLIVGTGGMALDGHWKVYLPVMIGSFILMVPALFIAERRARMKPVFAGSVILLLLTQLGFMLSQHNFFALVSVLLFFFVAFNILEASLPSLVSRIAPPRAKGAALGVYNTTQSIGSFLGGVLGGTLAKHLGPSSVFIFGAALASVWVILAITMRAPPVVALREYPIQPHVNIEYVREALPKLSGVREVRVEDEKRMAYLKVNAERWDEAGLRKILEGGV